MTYGHVAGECRDLGFVEDFVEQTLSLDPAELAAVVTGNDATTLLATVLEGVKSVICNVGGIRCSVDAEDTTFFVEFAFWTNHRYKFNKMFGII